MDEIKLENRLTSVEKLASSNLHRIDELEEQHGVLNRLVTSVEVMAVEQKNQTAQMGRIDGKVDTVAAKVDTLEKKPGRRWDLLVELIIAAAVGYILARAGLAG